MSDAAPAPSIVNDVEHHRFAVVDGGNASADDVEGELVYRLDGDRLILIHTGVDESLQGRGLAAQLVKAALDYARPSGLTIVPWCPYARHWLREHPDAAGDIRVDWDTPRPSELTESDS
jgi:predicted GNAT family acetyltransferase